MDTALRIERIWRLERLARASQLIVQRPGGNNFYNNVSYNNGLAGFEGAGFFLAGGSADTGNVIENNIVYAGASSTFMDVTPGTGSGNTFDYNLTCCPAQPGRPAY